MHIRGEEDANDRQVKFVVLQRGSFTALQSEVSGQRETVKLVYYESVVSSFPASRKTSGDEVKDDKGRAIHTSVLERNGACSEQGIDRV